MSNVLDTKANLVAVPIVLGEKVRTIKFDLNAFAELEARFGSVQNAMQEMQSGGVKAIRTILWAGLIHEEAILDQITGEPIGYNITPYQVGGWIAPNMLPDVSAKLTQAMGLGYPDVENIPGAKEELQKLGIDVETLKDPTKAEEVKND